MELKVYYSALHACYATGYCKEEAARAMAENDPYPDEHYPHDIELLPDGPVLELEFAELEEFAERGRLGWKEAFQLVINEDTYFSGNGVVLVTPKRFLELHGITEPGVVFGA